MILQILLKSNVSHRDLPIHHMGAKFQKKFWLQNFDIMYKGEFVVHGPEDIKKIKNGDTIYICVH